MRDVSVIIVVNGLGIGCQLHKPQKARHTNVLFGQLDRHYSIKKGKDPAPLKRCGSLFFRASEEDIKKIRKYGIGPFSVAVIHGGPGASGEMAPVAKELALVCGILKIRMLSWHNSGS